MSEHTEILRDIKILLVVFLSLAAIYTGAFIAFNTITIRALHAVEQCVDRPDFLFKQCYDSKR